MYRVLVKSAIFLTPLILLFIFASKASAEWWAYYREDSYYGIWATIWTPVSAPFTPQGASQSHSVTNYPPHWMQAGWLYYHGYQQPKKYYEYCAENCENDPNQYHLQEVGTQLWGTSVKYEVSYDGSMGPKTWCVWMGGVRQFCKNDICTPPTPVIAQSEVHTNSHTVIDTYYMGVRIKNSSGIWILPNLNNLYMDFPYQATKLSNENFRTYRLQTSEIYLPLVFKNH